MSFLAKLSASIKIDEAPNEAAIRAVEIPSPGPTSNITFPLRVEVDEKIKDADISKIESNFLEAIQQAHESSTKMMKDKMNDLTGGLNFNLPGFESND